VSRLPIRLRLALTLGVVMSVVLTAMGAFVYFRLERSLNASVDRDLHAQLQEIERRTGSGQSLGEPVDPDTRVLSEFLDENGRLVAQGSLHLRPFLTSVDARRVLDGQQISRDGSLPGLQGEWRLLATRVTSGSGEVVVAVAAPLRERDDALSHLLVQLLIAGVVGVAVAVVAGYGLAAGALRPVEAMRRRADEISSATPTTRLPVPRPRDEIRRLGETLNAMLERIGHALEHERRFVADASHELRTPLSLLKTELDLALRRPRSSEELEAALRSASAETDRLVRIAEDLLLIARSDQSRLPLRPETIDVAELADSVAARFGARVEEQGRSLRVDIPVATTLEGDRLRLEQALGNLVDNALEHGAGTVTVSTRSVDGWLELHVRDEGSGFPPAFADHAFDRFSRGDESRSGGGSGLGLAIVDLVARSHGGSAAASTLGQGADVWLRLPAVRSGGPEDKPESDA
jgi:two-component system OmpR family sensor kinase